MKRFLYLFAFLSLVSSSFGQAYSSIFREVGNRSGDDLAITPRWYGVTGATSMESSLYFDSLRMGTSDRLWKVDQVGSPNYRFHIQQERIQVALDQAMTAGTLTVNVVEPDTLAILDSGTYQVDIVSATAAAAKPVTILAIGDSTTAAGLWTQQMLDLSTANASGVQVTLSGTNGTPPNIHEGNSGWTTALWYQPPGTVWPSSPTGNDSYASQNPFVNVTGTKFDFAFYLTDTGQPVPDVVIWHLGINDVFGQATDAGTETLMDTFLTQMDEMIGTVVAGDVGSVIESNANAANIIAVPVSAFEDIDGFAASYTQQYQWQRYRRNIGICQRRIIEHYPVASEASKIYLVPWNVAVDLKHSLLRAASAPWNLHSTESTTRALAGVHPGTAGYKQMGDMMWSALNVLQVNESIVP